MRSRFYRSTPVRRALARILSRAPRALQPASAEVFSGRGASFRLADPFLTGIGRSLYAEGADVVEPETMGIFLDLCASARTVFDVGAHIGHYTLMAKTFHPSIRIIAFEPQIDLRATLSRSLALNCWSDVVTEAVALSDFEGEASLYIPNGDSEASLNPAFRSHAIERRVPVRTLDSYCVENAIPGIDVLKVDTESTEPRVLRGGRSIIGDSRPEIVCEVLLGRTEVELTDFLRPLGYTFLHLTATGPVARDVISGDPEYRDLNYLFTTRPERFIGRLRR